MEQLRIEPLDKRHHVRSEFSCGYSALDSFIRTLATQYDRRKLGKTMVAVRGSNPRVIGYYTLAAGMIVFDKLPANVAKSLARHPIPVILLARLAVDRSVQGERIGEAPLKDALRRCVEPSQALGVFAVEVDAIDERAKQFYSKYGFQPLVDDTLHLYLPIRIIEQSLSPVKKSR